MDICFERYFELSKDEYSKIKKFIDNNIDTFESILAPIPDFIDLYKKSYNNYRYYPFNFHFIKIMINVFVLSVNIVNFVKKIIMF